ncbi:hypothetical protein, partial [Burkholderia multivorans]|uniref:hypothetical protein n=1 Tax=Burkholderia multivorans TaxID=87883 RepID=UPI00265E59FD
VDRLSARLEERDDPVRAALPGTIQHWNLSLNPPHTRNSGYLRRPGVRRTRLRDLFPNAHTRPRLRRRPFSEEKEDNAVMKLHVQFHRKLQASLAFQ